MKVLGSRLKELRKGIGKSQAIVSSELEMPQTTYAGYELDKTEPNIEKLVRIAIYYEVSTDYLVGKTNTKYTQAELDFYNEIKEKGIEQLIRDYNISLGDKAMDPKEEKILMKLIKSFVEGE